LKAHLENNKIINSVALFRQARLGSSKQDTSVFVPIVSHSETVNLFTLWLRDYLWFFFKFSNLLITDPLASPKILSTLETLESGVHF